MRCPRFLRTLPVLLLALALASCGSSFGRDSRQLGGECRSDADCEGVCRTGGDFPGGFCSFTCSRNADCPLDAVCVSKDGGTCLPRCSSQADCSDALGGLYFCKDKDLKEGGKVLVCLGD